TLDQRARHHGGRDLAFARQQSAARLVALPDHARPARGLHVIEQLHELILDQPALLLYHQHILEAVGKSARALGFERPREAHLVEPQARRRRLALADPEVLERLAQIEIGLARADDAEPRRGTVPDDPVDRVRAYEGRDRFHLGPVEPPLLVERRIGPADVEPA